MKKPELQSFCHLRSRFNCDFQIFAAKDFDQLRFDDSFSFSPSSGISIVIKGPQCICGVNPSFEADQSLDIMHVQIVQGISNFIAN